MRPASSATAWRQWPKFGKLTTPWRATRAISRRIPSTLCIACSVCDSTTVSNMPVGEQTQPGVQVLLHDIDTLLDTERDVIVVDLDAVAAARLGVAQVRKQRTVAAAEIEHAAARRDPVGDLREVDPQAHCPHSCAMLSK